MMMVITMQTVMKIVVMMLVSECFAMGPEVLFSLMLEPWCNEGCPLRTEGLQITPITGGFAQSPNEQLCDPGRAGHTH